MTFAASDATVQTEPSQSQFRLSTLFWVTTAAAMLLTYARSFGITELRLGLSYAVFVVLFATVFGSVTRAWNDAYFWSSLITLVAFIAVAGYPMPIREIVYGWGVVGAACGALHGTHRPRRFTLGVISGAILGFVGMELCVLLSSHQSGGILVLFDIFGAAVVGAMLRPFVDVVHSLQRRTQLPRVVLAAWLVCCVVIGKAFVS